MNVRTAVEVRNELLVQFTLELGKRKGTESQLDEDGKTSRFFSTDPATLVV